MANASRVIAAAPQPFFQPASRLARNSARNVLYRSNSQDFNGVNGMNFTINNNVSAPRQGILS